MVSSSELPGWAGVVSVVAAGDLVVQVAADRPGCRSRRCSAVGTPAAACRRAPPARPARSGPSPVKPIRFAARSCPGTTRRLVADHPDAVQVQRRSLRRRSPPARPRARYSNRDSRRRRACAAASSGNSWSVGTPSTGTSASAVLAGFLTRPGRRRRTGPRAVPREQPRRAVQDAAPRRRQVDRLQSQRRAPSWARAGASVICICDQPAADDEEQGQNQRGTQPQPPGLFGQPGAGRHAGADPPWGRERLTRGTGGRPPCPGTGWPGPGPRGRGPCGHWPYGHWWYGHWWYGHRWADHPRPQWSHRCRRWPIGPGVRSPARQRPTAARRCSWPARP